MLCQRVRWGAENKKHLEPLSFSSCESEGRTLPRINNHESGFLLP